MRGRFSSTTRISSSPAAKRRAHEGARRLQPLLEQALLHCQRQVYPADPQPRLRSSVVFGQHDLHALRVDRNGARAVDRIGRALEADPAAGVAREREAVQAEIQVVLEMRRVQDRHPAVNEPLLALVCDRRRACSRIVACEHEHAPVSRAARVVAVLERVRGAIDARALAVPDPEDAVVARPFVQARLLRAPHRGGGQVLVHPGLEADVVLVEKGLRLPECHVVGPEGRAPVARDEAGRVQAGRQVALALHQGQPYERLHAGEPDPPRGEPVAVIQRVALIMARGRVHQATFPRTRERFNPRVDPSRAPNAAGRWCHSSPEAPRRPGSPSSVEPRGNRWRSACRASSPSYAVLSRGPRPLRAP